MTTQPDRHNCTAAQKHVFVSASPGNLPLHKYQSLSRPKQQAPANAALGN